jgi:cyanophycin synthetase
MEVSRIRALRGPNLWSRHTAIEAIVSCIGTDCSISDMPGFEDRLRASFPEIGFLQPAGHQGSISMAPSVCRNRPDAWLLSVVPCRRLNPVCIKW